MRFDKHSANCDYVHNMEAVEGKISEGASESGTKFILDQAAVKYIRARLRASSIAEWILQFYNWSKEKYHGADRVRFLDCAHIYVSTARRLESHEPMSELRKSIHALETTQSARKGSGGGSILMREKRGSNTYVNDISSTQMDRLAVLKQFEFHLYAEGAGKTRVPSGKTISVLNGHAKSYMKQRNLAREAIRQTEAILSLMAPGLPKIWASRYLEVMKLLEVRGIDAIESIAELWSSQAERLSDGVTERERQTGKAEITYGGKSDPDGRMLVLHAFQSVSEWGKYRNTNFLSEEASAVADADKFGINDSEGLDSDLAFIPRITASLRYLQKHLSPSSKESWWRIDVLTSYSAPQQVAIVVSLAISCISLTLCLTFCISKVVEQWLDGGENLQLAAATVALAFVAFVWQASL